MPLGASAMLDAFCCRKQRDGEWMCSRVGSDRDISMCIYGFGISIHAPAWGATAKEAKVKENRLFIFV